MNTRKKGPRAFGFFLSILSVSFVLYVTLFPFTFGLHNVHQPQRLAGVDAVLAYDVISNLLLFVPVGVGIAAWAWGEGVRGWPMYVLVQCFGTLLSLGVENLQVLLPRQPSVVDVVTNSAGTLVGLSLFLLWMRVRRSRAIAPER
jgi:glycopeptide antibiotics resistance protein